MSEKNTKKAILLGLGAVAAYKFINGDGIFNKPRFYFIYKAAKKYLSSSHPDAVLGKIIKTSGGASCIIYENNRQFMLSVSKAPDGTYIFHESEL